MYAAPVFAQSMPSPRPLRYQYAPFTGRDDSERHSPSHGSLRAHVPLRNTSSTWNPARPGPPAEPPPLPVHGVPPVGVGDCVVAPLDPVGDVLPPLSPLVVGAPCCSDA